MTGTALVTGASSGIGLATARALLAAGYEVYGTSRRPEAQTEPEKAGIRFLSLDLTDERSIEALLPGLPPLDVLVNNAGASLMGAVEETPMDKVLGLYQLALFGPIRLMQGVLPAMRQRGGGLIVNVGSLAELTPVPCSSVYASAKAALHALSVGLRQEARPFGIRVVTVAPSFIHTPIRQERLLDGQSPYAPMIRSAGAIRDRGIQTGSPPEAAADCILKIVKTKNPRSYYVIGKQSGLLAFMHRFLPERLREAVVRKHFKLDTEKQ